MEFYLHFSAADLIRVTVTPIAAAPRAMACTSEHFAAAARSAWLGASRLAAALHCF
jgi:hypothetical protein